MRLSTPSDQPEQLVGAIFISGVWNFLAPPSSDPPSNPFHSMLHAPKDCRPHQVARGPLMPFLEQHGSSFLSALTEGHSGHAPQAGALDAQALSAAPQSPWPGSQKRLGFSPSNWYGLLNLSAYKALHPAWDQERGPFAPCRRARGQPSPGPGVSLVPLSLFRQM